MSEAAKSINIEHYLRLVIKYRWLILIPLSIALLVGIYLSLTLPRVYVAKTTILVEAQRVPKGFVKSLVSIGIDARIRTISQQILSRTNLEKIIKQFRLYSKSKHQKMYMEDKVKNVRNRIKVNVTKAGRRGADAFSITFKDAEPETAMKIANTLAAFFIDENLKVREAQAIGTSSFLDDELEMMRKRLVSVEEALRAYRRENMGELPEQLDANLRILDRLQLELSQKQESLRSAKNRLADIEKMIQTILEAKRTTPLPDDRIRPAPTVPGTEDEPVSNLDALKNQLALAKMRYTSRHPDIIKLKRIIAAMEAEEASQKKPIPEPRNSMNSSADETPESTPTVDIKFLAARDSITREMSTFIRNISELQEKIGSYSKRVENTPKREQELLSLNRDYENIQEQYSSMLSRKLEAEIAVNMERKQKGEQFRVIDPARLPRKPSEPDMKKLFIVTIAIGLGIGGGVIFLIDFFDTSFKSPYDVESLLGVPILAVIPDIQQKKDKKRWKIVLIVNLLSLSTTVFLIASFAVLAFYGVDETTSLIRRYVKF